MRQALAQVVIALGRVITAAGFRMLPKPKPFKASAEFVRAAEELNEVSEFVRAAEEQETMH